jgi:hypothetical protein
MADVTGNNWKMLKAGIDITITSIHVEDTKQAPNFFLFCIVVVPHLHENTEPNLDLHGPK